MKFYHFGRNEKKSFRPVEDGKGHACRPASSASVERSFSNANNLITKKRNRLSKDSIQKNMLLHSWYKCEFLFK